MTYITRTYHEYAKRFIRHNVNRLYKICYINIIIVDALVFVNRMMCVCVMRDLLHIGDVLLCKY